MQITIQQTEILEGQPSVLIQFGDNQVILNQDEFKSLQKNIDLFVDSGVKLIGYSTYFKPSDNHSEYLEIRTKIKGEYHCENLH